MVILYLFNETYLQIRADSGGYIGVKKDGVDSVDGLKGTYDVAISPDGNFVYGAGRGDKAVAVFSRDPSSVFMIGIRRCLN
jgi:DNA-binding beta-propeller fold protein YncE